MDDAWLALPVLAWASLWLLAWAEAAARRRAAAGEVAPPAPPAWAPWAILGVALAVALLRMGFALDRELRNVDELQYAATADVARRLGASLFGPRNLGLHQWLFLLGSWEAPFAVVDALTSLAVGATGGLLGLTLLRARRDLTPALLAPALYGVGLLRHEGLTSNKEPWVGLALAAWAFVRLSSPGTSGPRQVAAGACLGLAAAFKEQALPCALLEAALLGLDAWRAVRGGEAARAALARAARHAGLAALGWGLGLLPLVVGLVAHGALGGFVGFLVDMGAHGGRPDADVARVLGAPPPPPLEPLGPALGALAFAVGLLPLWTSPVSLLGCARIARLALEGDPTAPARRAVWGLALLALAGVACASIGQRWFGHYLMLALPGLAACAALGLVDAARALRGGAGRWAAGALLALAAANAAAEARLLHATPEVAAGSGALDDPALRAVAEVVRERTPPGETTFVWGWRPELYFLAERRPASRYVCGLTATKAEALEDLRRERPRAIVVAGPRGLAAGEEHDPYALAHHPDLAAWLRAERYAPFAHVDGYLILVRP